VAGDLDLLDGREVPVGLLLRSLQLRPELPSSGHVDALLLGELQELVDLLLDLDHVPLELQMRCGGQTEPPWVVSVASRLPMNRRRCCHDSGNGWYPIWWPAAAAGRKGRRSGLPGPQSSEGHREARSRHSVEEGSARVSMRPCSGGRPGQSPPSPHDPGADQRCVVAADVEDAARLPVNPELPPGQDLEELLESAQSAGSGDESVGPTISAFRSCIDSVTMSSVIPEWATSRWFRSARGSPRRPRRRRRERSAPVAPSDPSSSLRRPGPMIGSRGASQSRSGVQVAGVLTRAGTAEHADLFELRFRDRHFPLQCSSDESGGRAGARPGLAPPDRFQRLNAASARPAGPLPRPGGELLRTQDVARGKAEAGHGLLFSLQE
jgi:hypothetical protein